MPNIYTKYIEPNECHALNCAPKRDRGSKTYRKGEVIRCSHENIYLCVEYISTLQLNPWKRWKKLSPWLNPFKYDKADKLLKRGIA